METGRNRILARPVACFKRSETLWFPVGRDGGKSLLDFKTGLRDDVEHYVIRLLGRPFSVFSQLPAIEPVDVPTSFRATSLFLNSAVGGSSASHLAVPGKRGSWAISKSSCVYCALACRALVLADTAGRVGSGDTAVPAKACFARKKSRLASALGP